MEMMAEMVRRYSEIRTMQVAHLVYVWLSREGKESKAVREKFEEKIDGYSAGKLDHAADVMLCIWEMSNKKDERPASSNPSTSSSIKTVLSGDAGPMGRNIRSALVKSMKEGHLFDRKYWTKRSREGEVEPTYFSSAAIYAELLNFDARKSLIQGDILGVY